MKMRNIPGMDTHTLRAELHSDAAFEKRAEAMIENRLDFLHELVERRRSLGLSQAEIGELLGVSPQAVSKYERYDWDPRLSTLERYANAVGVVLETKALPCPWTAGGNSKSFSVTISRSGDSRSPLFDLVESSRIESGWSTSKAAESKRTDFALAS